MMVFTKVHGGALLVACGLLCLALVMGVSFQWPVDLRHTALFAMPTMLITIPYIGRRIKQASDKQRQRERAHEASALQARIALELSAQAADEKRREP